MDIYPFSNLDIGYGVYPKFPNFIISYPYPKIIIISMSDKGYFEAIAGCGPDFCALRAKGRFQET